MEYWPPGSQPDFLGTRACQSLPLPYCVPCVHILALRLPASPEFLRAKSRLSSTFRPFLRNNSAPCHVSILLEDSYREFEPVNQPVRQRPQSFDTHVGSLPRV